MIDNNLITIKTLNEMLSVCRLLGCWIRVGWQTEGPSENRLADHSTDWRENIIESYIGAK